MNYFQFLNFTPFILQLYLAIIYIVLSAFPDFQFTSGYIFILFYSYVKCQTNVQQKNNHLFPCSIAYFHSSPTAFLNINITSDISMDVSLLISEIAIIQSL